MAGHTHGATSGKLLWASLFLSVLFVLAESIFGWKAHSLALVSDAGHNASDALALGLAAYAVWVAKRPASQGKTFGYHRAAILTALMNAGALVLIALGIFYEAWQSVHSTHTVHGTIVMVVAAFGVFMNTVIAYWLRDASHSSINARAVYIHMAGDAFSSFGVLLAGAAIKWLGWTSADSAVSVLIGLFILYTSWGVINEAVNILMEGTPKGLDTESVVRAMKSNECVVDVHDLHVWAVSDGINFLSCHVVLPDDCTMQMSSVVVQELNTQLHDEFGIGHATIQTERAADIGCNMNPNHLYCALESQSHTDCSHAH